MTTFKFEEWSSFASDIRDKTIAGEIPFNEYYTQIRKYLFFVYNDSNFDIGIVLILQFFNRVVILEILYYRLKKFERVRIMSIDKAIESDFDISMQ